MILAMALALATVPAAAQDTVQIFDVPDGGYEGTDTYLADDLWNEYVVDVPRGYDLEYSFQITGQGSIRVLLVKEVGTLEILEAGVNFYIEFSEPEPASSFSARFPADFGFDQDYTILVNSTDGEVTYTASIHLYQVEKPDYTIHYILIALGFVGLVAFSWKYVVWQDKKERESKEAVRQSKRNRRNRKNR